ncbi:glutaredoxin [Malassezia obtusa]|uniref:Glutaredoxin n=1 Tax=Malassezia obtusa TaxID=76774 RepID=A0AAF0IV76_9BASI|nr:glutaredoxin [Malassezia obtusa]
MSTTTGQPANVVAIASPDMFTELMQQDLDRVTLLNFWAPWAQPCEQMNQAVLEFAPRYPHALFMNVEAEEQPDVAESFDVEAVPTVVLLRGHTLLAKISGCNVPAVSEALATHARGGARLDGLSQTSAAPQAAPSTYEAAGAPVASSDGRLHEAPADIDLGAESPQDTERRCHELMKRSKVMLFMKGHPNQPRCGFSQKTVALLREQGVEFDHYDILSDENVRQMLKKINEWPTFPQVIVNGELIGGLDILK